MMCRGHVKAAGDIIITYMYCRRHNYYVHANTKSVTMCTCGVYFMCVMYTSSPTLTNLASLQIVWDMYTVNSILFIVTRD